jgi:Ni,Fe-hydrogenase III large subunit
LALTFKLRGEQIVAVDPPTTGYCRRGIESLVNGSPPARALDIVERSCSLAGHSHRVALCQALEAGSAAAPSARAQLLRALFAEIERIQARLWYLAALARAANAQASLREALDQREALYDALTEATGERHFWELGEVGGVRRLDDAALTALGAALDGVAAAAQTWRVATSRQSPLGRIGTGVGTVSEQMVTELGLTGPVAKASGITADLRRDAPYGGYALVSFAWDAGGPPEPKGDVAARAAFAAHDVAMSVQLARTLLEALPAASDDAVVPAAGAKGSGSGQARIETPHGPVEIAAGLKSDGAVRDFSLQTPGAGTLAALPLLLEGQPIALAPVILASLDLCVECLDH